MVDEVTAAPEDAAPAETPEVDPARKALVARWISDIKESKGYWKDAFKRMDQCMQWAAEGADEDWIKDDNYVVPIINRHINQAVAMLYGRNPKAIAKRKQKLLYQIWDGDPASIQTAMASLQQAMQAPPAMGHNGGPPMDPMAPAPAPVIDPQAVALLQEIQQVKQQILLYDRMAKTMELLFAYFLDEQDAGYREEFKALVRRTKVCGVAYVKLGFQRLLSMTPDLEGRIADATEQLATVQRLLAEQPEMEQGDAAAEELRLMLEDLKAQAEVIAREGPTISFPRADEIIIDKRCRNLKTFSGARFIAHEFDMTPDEIMEVYKVDVKKEYKAYNDGKEVTGGKAEDSCAKVWEVQDKKRQQVFVVCDGYCDFLKPPAAPDVRIDRFWTVFPLVFNQVESKKTIYPPSDVWAARHMQREYNSSRQGLREHRVASRPKYVAVKGMLDKEDLDKLNSAIAHSIIEINAAAAGEPVDKIVKRMDLVGIDPNLYETESTFADMQRVVGSQEANLGGTSGATATETSIAENSRMSSKDDNVDDLDTMLTALARGMGQLMLLNLSKETVVEIAGPGAVWPEMTPSRETISKDLVLDIIAGSSGRPNKAADLANFERAAPWLVQLPGVNPMPLAKKGLDLLEIDLEEAYVEGLPSITAMNQMAAKPTGDPSTDPNQQGGKGGANAEKPAENEPQSQPAMPAPGAGDAPMQNAGI